MRTFSLLISRERPHCKAESLYIDPKVMKVKGLSGLRCACAQTYPHDLWVSLELCDIVDIRRCIHTKSTMKKHYRSS